MALEEILVSWESEWWIFVLNVQILHLLPLIYPIFTCLDPNPYLEYESGSTKLLNMDPIWIRICNCCMLCRRVGGGARGACHLHPRLSLQELLRGQQRGQAEGATPR